MYYTATQALSHGEAPLQPEEHKLLMRMVLKSLFVTLSWFELEKN